MSLLYYTVCIHIKERLMCFGCHFNICARHARGGAAEGSAAGKETLAIVTETSIWATRVLATGGDLKKSDLATGGDLKKGDLATGDQKKEKRSLPPDDVDQEQQQLKAALSLESKLPGIFPGKASLIEREESAGSEKCHSESHLLEEGMESMVGKSAEGAPPGLSQYYTTKNLPKKCGVDLV